ncbi:DUF1616 domain-containing protein [Halopiger djelfimassiliensis]|uniref:DUF1616 domain-containing protein n=1 Tax=Halopiger djelfimassiliensis TaxID=1293047 RepID=UPI000677CCB1|nr:DUF1616 domain-containing protein [Halopiger djelfimassiliensis]
MVDRRSLQLLLPRPLRKLPGDLTCMLVMTVLVNVTVFTPVVRETPLRIPFGTAFALVVPGYVFLAVLFPEASDPEPSLRSGIDGIERAVLSVGLSLTIIPLVGLGLHFTPWGLRLGPIMVVLTGFTLVTTGAAAVRRWQLPENERFRVPYREWYRAGRSELLEPESRIDGTLNVLLVLSILLVIGVVTFAIVAPPAGEQFSAVYLLTEDDDGELVADDFPREFVDGESREIVLGVDNHEHRPVEYTVVVLEQRAEPISNETNASGSSTDTIGNGTTITEQRELDRLQVNLDHNESWHHTYDLEPTMTGDDVRIVWLLYPDNDVPETPSLETTEYYTDLWITVTPSNESSRA